MKMGNKKQSGKKQDRSSFAFSLPGQLPFSSRRSFGRRKPGETGGNDPGKSFSIEVFGVGG